MKDCYGRIFNPKTIKNKDAIGFIEAKPLSEWSEIDIARKVVLIKSKNNGDRLYLLSDLKQMLKANYFCRLEDPFTREDILEQVPDFKAAIELEEQASHYNASILDKNPHFIPLLTTYVKELLHAEDEARYRNAKKKDIRANNSEAMVKFYDTVAHFSEEEKKDFFSLFITNRRPYSQGNIWVLPAKWEPAYSFTEQLIYNLFIQSNQYTPYPHRNVLLADLITDPEDACMHSWGMDVMHLLLEYHIGNGQEFQVFTQEDSPFALGMEKELRQRIHAEFTLGSLDANKGQDAFAKATLIMDNQMIVKLEKKCTDYMDSLLSKAGIQKGEGYPSPVQLGDSQNPLIKKYQAVYDMYLSLQGEDEEECLSQFEALYNEKDRQETIAMHRDNAGIRFLNIAASILSLGIKNLVSYCETGYWGFWNSRGAAFNEDVASILQPALSK